MIFNKIFESILAGVKEENIALYKSMAQYFKENNVGNTEEFYFKFIYPFESILNGFIAAELSSSIELQFLLLNHTFVNQHFEKIFEQVEGVACCSDKSRIVLFKLYMFYKEGMEISYDTTQEYTYFLPKKVFTTNKEIIEFFKALENLYYGNPKDYIRIYQSIFA